MVEPPQASVCVPPLSSRNHVGELGSGHAVPVADPRGVSALLERPNAHLYETGRMRRVHPNILKRVLVQVCGVNLGLLMWHLTGVGTPRSLQGRASALVEALNGHLSRCWGRVRRFWTPERHDRPDSSWDGLATRQYGHAILN